MALSTWCVDCAPPSRSSSSAPPAAPPTLNLRALTLNTALGEPPSLPST